MEFSIAQASFFLAFNVGRADGNFSPSEIEDVARQSSSFRAYAHEFLKDQSSFIGLVQNGILNEQSALEKIKNSCSHEEILDFLADCVAIVLADNEVHEKEKEKFQEYARFLEIDYNVAVNAWKSRNNA